LIELTKSMEEVKADSDLQKLKKIKYSEFSV